MSEVLFLSPVIPDPNGAGRHKRAHQWIESLCTNSRVHLLVIDSEHQKQKAQMLVSRLPLASFHLLEVPNDEFTCTKARDELPNFLIRLCCTTPKRGNSLLGWTDFVPSAMELIPQWYGDIEFDRLVCFRIYLTEYAHYLATVAKIRYMDLDMDDIESSTWGKIGLLCVRSGRLKKAARHAMAAFQYFRFEESLLHKFRQVFVCSYQDQQKLLKRFPTLKIKVFFNRLPKRSFRQLSEGNIHCILFVGTLGYYPNEHAVCWFVTSVLPRLRETGGMWVFKVAGFAASDKLREWLSTQRGVELLGEVDDLEAIYEAAGIVVSPLQAGGGTKLKMIEAMQRGRPIIATAESVYGLQVSPYQHYLPADTANEFVQQCRRLESDYKLRLQLSKNGQSLVSKLYVYDTHDLK